LEILGEGQHLITDASHTFEGFIPTKQETKKLHQVTASTRDNVGLILHADVRYQIVSPETAVTQIDDIENSIKEIAEISISQVVSHHSLSDFAPAVSTANFSGSRESHGIGDVIKELSRMITEQLSRLGIQLINIGITSWKINDTNLAHELAQGAVVTSQAQSKLMAAENAARVRGIETDAEGKAITTLATAKAHAIETTGDAYRKFAEGTKNFPAALAIFQKEQEVEMVSRAKNANLFFQASGTGQLPPVVSTINTAPQQ
jgi:regulator of protease activity HflC (stomatin/prohibitin superfamily)